MFPFSPLFLGHSHENASALSICEKFQSAIYVLHHNVFGLKSRELRARESFKYARVASSHSFSLTPPSCEVSHFTHEGQNRLETWTLLLGLPMILTGCTCRTHPQSASSLLRQWKTHPCSDLYGQKKSYYNNVFRGTMIR